LRIRDKIEFVALLIAAALVLYLFYDVYIKKGLFAKPESLKAKFIPDFLLSDLEDNVHDSKKIIGLSPFTLFVFFSPSDCAPCLLERELWKEISDSNKVNIIGIARHVDKRELKDWIENSEISFLVLYDEKSMLTEKLGIDKTPLKLLTDNRGNILFIDNIRATRSEQKVFVNKLDELLGLFSK